MKRVGLGLVGCGVVGGGVLRHLSSKRDLLAKRIGVDLQVVRVAVRDLSKERPGVSSDQLCRDWSSVVHDPKVDIVVEVMGGTDEARLVAEASLRAGKPLVTANKALLAEHGVELFPMAVAHQTAIYFEASTAGGIPIVQALRAGLVANHIDSIHGIINGTCNYILSEMARRGAEFAQVLQEAKEKGYAEADESLDVDGIDAAHKAVILASLAYGFWVPMNQVFVEGIRKVQVQDVKFAADLGYTLKLLAVIKHSHEGIEVRVHPTLIPSSHVLASVGGVFNAVAVHGDVVGSTLFYGRGAGASPTASAVLADIAAATVDLRRSAPADCGFVSHRLYPGVLPVDEVLTRYYVRLMVVDRPGVLAQVAAIFGAHGIGISSVIQPEGHELGAVPLVLLLDRAREKSFSTAFAEIEKLEVVLEPVAALRLEDFS